MERLRRKTNTLQSVTSIFSIAGVLSSWVTTFFPHFVSKLADNPQHLEGGEVTEAGVFAQMDVFIWVSVMIIIIGGLLIALNYNYWNIRKNSSVVTGGGKMKWLLVLIFLLSCLTFVMFGISLPNAIFNLTNPDVLNLQFPLIAAARNNFFVGALVGLTGYALALICAGLVFFFLIVLPHTLRTKKINKSLIH